MPRSDSPHRIASDATSPPLAPIYATHPAEDVQENLSSYLRQLRPRIVEAATRVRTRCAPAFDTWSTSSDRTDGAFRMAQDAATIQRLFAHHAAPLASPIVSQIRDRYPQLCKWSSTADLDDDDASSDETRVAIAQSVAHARQTWAAYAMARRDVVDSAAADATGSALAARSACAPRHASLAAEKRAVEAAFAEYTTDVTAASHARVLSLHLRLDDACRTVARTQAAYDACDASLADAVGKWRQTFRQLQLAETELRTAQRHWYGRLWDLLLRDLTVDTPLETFRAYVSEIRAVHGQLGALETSAKSFNGRLHALMNDRSKLFAHAAHRTSASRRCVQAMDELSAFVRTHLHELPHVSMDAMGGGASTRPSPVDAPPIAAWWRTTRLRPIDVSRAVTVRMQRDALRMWSCKAPYDAGRLTPAGVVAYCTDLWAPDDGRPLESWTDLTYRCRQIHEMQRLSAVAGGAVDDAVRRRRLRLWTMVNRHVQQHAQHRQRHVEYFRTMRRDASADVDQLHEAATRLVCMCEQARRLAGLGAQVCVINTAFPLARLPLPTGLHAIAVYDDALDQAHRTYQSLSNRWLVQLRHRGAEYRAQCAQLQTSRTAQQQTHHDQTTRRCAAIRQVISDKQAQLVQTCERIQRLQQHIDEVQDVHTTMRQLSSCDATTVDLDEDYDCELAVRLDEAMRQRNALVDEVAALARTLPPNDPALAMDARAAEALPRPAADALPAPTTVDAQLEEALSASQTIQRQVADETRRRRCIARQIDETRRYLRYEMTRPDHLGRPMVGEPLRLHVQRPFVLRNRTPCAVHVPLLHVAFLRRAEMSVDAIRWVDAHGRCWPGRRSTTTREVYTCEPSRSKDTTPPGLEHVAVLPLSVQVDVDRPWHTIRTLAMDVHVSLDFDDVVAQHARRETSHHTVSVSVCLQPASWVERLPSQMAMWCFLAMLLLRLKSPLQKG